MIKFQDTHGEIVITVYYVSVTILHEFFLEKTTKGIVDMGFTHMTPIQHKTVLPLLKGRFVIAIMQQNFSIVPLLKKPIIMTLSFEIHFCEILYFSIYNRIIPYLETCLELLKPDQAKLWRSSSLL